MVNAAEVQRALHDHRCRGPLRVQELPAGRYSMNVTKGGYVDAPVRAAAAVRAGHAVHPRRRAGAHRMNVALPRGSVIAGRITDEFGEPIAQAQVSAQRYQYGPDGQRRLQPAGGGHDRRPRPVPAVQPDARRVHRQRRRAGTSSCRFGGHRRQRHERGLSANVPPRHGQRQRGADRHNHARSGVHVQFALERGADGAGVGRGDGLDRPRPGQRHGHADAVERHPQRRPRSDIADRRRCVLHVSPTCAGRLRPERAADRGAFDRHDRRRNPRPCRCRWAAPTSMAFAS